jgi:hypothetical protein
MSTSSSSNPSSSCKQPIGIEKFPTVELSELRDELSRGGLDSRQVAELIREFLTERGYGVSFDDAQAAAGDDGVLSGSLQRMQETLEKVAVLM